MTWPSTGVQLSKAAGLSRCQKVPVCAWGKIRPATTWSRRRNSFSMLEGMLSFCNLSTPARGKKMSRQPAVAVVSRNAARADPSEARKFTNKRKGSSRRTKLICIRVRIAIPKSSARVNRRRRSVLPVTRQSVPLTAASKTACSPPYPQQHSQRPRTTNGVGMARFFRRFLRRLKTTSTPP